ncbi:hypothetical protein NUG22_10940 [Saccharothrix longispora]|nr:hypothetical protein [Saccharothrix longispora]
MVKRLTTPFGLAVLGCLLLAGWATWTGGAFDGPVARDVRGSSVYAAPGVDLDEAAAERVLGNRRLVVVFLEPGAEDLRSACRAVDGAAEGTVVLVLSREGVDGDDYDRYGCALLPGRDDENFGKAVVAEMTIARGVDQFPDRPLEALKVVAVNYDLLVRAGTVPDGARVVSPSLPRYLIAGAALAGVVVGAAGLYFGARRAGTAVADLGARRAADTDARTALNAASAVLARQIVALDRDHPGRAPDEHRRLVADYARLMASGEQDPATLLPQVERLSRRCARLADARREARAAKPL